MNLSPHFTLQEFTASETASRKGLDNDLPIELLATAKQTAAMLERIRTTLAAPVTITSGYRSLAVNQAIGSSDTSDHVRAMAADIRCPGFGSPYEVAKALAREMDELGIGQVIHEFGSWVHVSMKKPSKVINRTLTIDSHGQRAGILPSTK